jgi:hypothetical protein
MNKSRSRSRHKKLDSKTKKCTIQFYPSIKKRLLYSPTSYQHYININNNKINANYNSSKKLFLVYLYFLTEYLNYSNTVVIIDSILDISVVTAIIHIFKNLNFIFYISHTKEEDKTINLKNVFIHDIKKFDEDLDQYKYKNILLICNYYGGSKKDETILNYLNKFYNFVKQIKPIKSMIKFRLPFSEETFCENKFLIGDKCNFDYFSGELLLPPYASLLSNETLLIVDQNPSIKKYDCVEYEEKMFFHNFVVRNKPIITKNKIYSWDETQTYCIIKKCEDKMKIKSENLKNILNKL